MNLETNEVFWEKTMSVPSHDKGEQNIPRPPGQKQLASPLTTIWQRLTLFIAKIEDAAGADVEY